MASNKFCIQAVAEASGVSEERAGQIVQDLRRRVDAARAEGKAATAQEVMRIASQLGEQKKFAAAAKRREAAINIIKRQEIDARLKDMRDSGLMPHQSILATLEGKQQPGVVGGSDSVYNRAEAINAKWAASMEKQIAEIGDRVWKRMRKEPDFNGKVRREMWEIRTDGKGRPGITGDADARALAKVLKDHAEDARRRINAAGGMVGKLENWAPQSHDEGKVHRAGYDDWKEFVAPLLDEEDMGREVDADFLRAVYDDIVLGKFGRSSERLTPKNKSTQYAKSRVLHFKDADSQEAYMQKFGRGTNVIDQVTVPLRSTARDIALMERYGTNPQAMISSLIEEESKRIKADPDMDEAAKRKALKKLGTPQAFMSGNSSIGRAYNVVSGEAFRPENVTIAEIFSWIRVQQRLAKLGSATLSAFADLPIVTFAARNVTGRNILSAASESFKALAKPRTDIEREAMARLGVVVDGPLAENMIRFSGQDSLKGKAAKTQNFFFKVSGLQGWTDRLKSGYSLLLSKDLGENLGRSFDELPAGFKSMLQKNGNVTAAEWDAIRTIKPISGNGEKYMTPDMAQRLSDDAVLAFLHERVMKYDDTAKKNAIERGKVELETKLRAMFIETTRSAVIEPDAQTVRWLTGGLKAGSPAGEAWRMVTQFKGFPIAYQQRILGGKAWRKAGAESDIAGASMMIASLAAFGYMSMSLKDLAKGKEPKDPRKPETIVRALLQSGGLGVYGDFLLNDYNQYGGTFAETLTGPAVGTVGDLAKIFSTLLSGDVDVGSEAVRFAKYNTPFASLWYTRAGLDYAFWYHLQEMASPGSLRRTEKRLRKEYNQEFIVPPSKVAN